MVPTCRSPAVNVELRTRGVGLPELLNAPNAKPSLLIIRLLKPIGGSRPGASPSRSSLSAVSWRSSAAQSSQWSSCARARARSDAPSTPWRSTAPACPTNEYLGWLLPGSPARSRSRCHRAATRSTAPWPTTRRWAGRSHHRRCCHTRGAGDPQRRWQRWLLRPRDADRCPRCSSPRGWSGPVSPLRWAGSTSTCGPTATATRRGACRSCRDVEGGLTRRLPPVGRGRRRCPGADTGGE